MVSIRISLLIAFGATAMGAVLGTTLGFLAAQARGVVEQAVLVLIDVQAALPFLIMALAVLAFFGNSLPIFVGLMGFYGWERYARLARGLALSADAQGYAAAVRQLGASPARVYLRHVLPNVAATLVVAATLSFPEVILLESGLSFLGLGIQPPMTSLGNMIGYGREYLARAPWILLAPSVVVVLTTYSVSVLGDWLRDRLDPQLAPLVRPDEPALRDQMRPDAPQQAGAARRIRERRAPIQREHLERVAVRAMTRRRRRRGPAGPGQEIAPARPAMRGGRFLPQRDLALVEPAQPGRDRMDDACVTGRNERDVGIFDQQHDGLRLRAASLPRPTAGNRSSPSCGEALRDRAVVGEGGAADASRSCRGRARTCCEVSACTPGRTGRNCLPIES